MGKFGAYKFIGNGKNKGCLGRGNRKLPKIIGRRKG